MRRPSPYAFLVYPFLYFLTIFAIEIAPNSVCSPLCVNYPPANTSSPGSSWTRPPNLVCLDSDLIGSNATPGGLIWKSCLSCESTSAHHDDTTGENDVEWFLCMQKIPFMAGYKPDTKAVNIRYTLVWCIFGFGNPGRVNQTEAGVRCRDTCVGPNNSMEVALTNQTFDATSIEETPYDYCDANDRAFAKNIDNCTRCLQGANQSTILVNCKLPP